MQNISIGPVRETETQLVNEVTLGAKIKAARIQAGLSPSELASAVAASPGQLLNWERDRRKPSFEWLFKIARHLNCPLEYFVVGPNYDLESAAMSSDNTPLSKLEKLLVLRFRGAKMRTRIEVQKILRMEDGAD
ncbi:helix-turn-helix domain-containing protein [Rhizobium leguminosarum]|uniref:helix-turn-helix domain-containing protein n=1 Tax=Rhizobium leguminosarum TaxID=384 RepID=UPI001C96044C|nr:helix-turn-helix transcriptional regulator [Rhizobium leguminosarum]MBY5700598.1 helix-turn-helix transcriptional regulator [Rhizobium leguminosarum]